MARGRLAAEVMIEADNAMNFCAGQIESLRDQGPGGLADTAELFLQGVEDG